jgi:hypothetical protein
MPYFYLLHLRQCLETPFLQSRAYGANLQVTLKSKLGMWMGKSEDADEVANAVLLVLRYAFGNPCDVSNFLIKVSYHGDIEEDETALTCSRSFTQA